MRSRIFKLISENDVLVRAEALSNTKALRHVLCILKNLTHYFPSWSFVDSVNFFHPYNPPRLSSLSLLIRSILKELCHEIFRVLR